MLMLSETGWPDPSTTPRLVRYFADCAICCKVIVPAYLPMKFACATAGMIRASGRGAEFDVGATGCTTLTLRVVVDDDEAFDVYLPEALDVVMVTPPRLVPSGRPAVLACTVSVRPPAGMTPVDGV